jgi:hypothetical protein
MFRFIYDHSQVLQSFQKYVQSVAEYDLKFASSVSKSKVTLTSPSIRLSNVAASQIGPWPPLLRFHNNNVLRCEVVSLTTNPR